MMPPRKGGIAPSPPSTPSTSNVQTAVDTLTLPSYNAGSGSNRKLIVVYAIEDDQNGATGDDVSCLFGATPMEIVVRRKSHNSVDAQQFLCVFELDNPSGTANIALSGTKVVADSSSITAFVLENVLTGQGPASIAVSSDTTGGTQSAWSIDIVTPNDNCCVVSAYNHGGTSTIDTIPTGFTELAATLETSARTSVAFDADVGSAGSKTLNWGTTAGVSRVTSVALSYMKTDQTRTYPSIDGLNITLNPPGATWSALVDLYVFDSTDTEKFNGVLTAVNGAPGNSMATISDGQFTSDSDYSGVGTVANIADNNNSTLHWSDGGTVPLNIYAKWSASFSLKKIVLRMRTTVTYTLSSPPFTFKDRNGTTIPHIVMPYGGYDYDPSGGDSWVGSTGANYEVWF